MYDYEEGMTHCQREIRRLRFVCRENGERIDRLSSLLYNAIVYLQEATGNSSGCSPKERLEWYEKTLGITAEELSEIGIDWFDDLKSKED